MICPECKSEYKEGIVFCVDCNTSLVEELVEEKDLDEIEWTPLSSLPGNMYAEMVREVLENANIPCYIKTDFITSAYGVKGTGIPGAKAQIFVPVEYHDEAEGILKEIMEKDI